MRFHTARSLASVTSDRESWVTLFLARCQQLFSLLSSLAPLSNASRPSIALAGVAVRKQLGYDASSRDGSISGAQRRECLLGRIVIIRCCRRPRLDARPADLSRVTRERRTTRDARSRRGDGTRRTVSLSTVLPYCTVPCVVWRLIDRRTLIRLLHSRLQDERTRRLARLLGESVEFGNACVVWLR